MATKLRLFLDASVVIAGIASMTGASGIILALCEAGQVRAVVSEAILDGCQRNLQRKLPEMMPRFQRVVEALQYLFTVDITTNLKDETKRRHCSPCPVWIGQSKDSFNPPDSLFYAMEQTMW